MAAAVGEINERNQNEIVPSIRPLGGGTLSPGLIQITKKHNATDFITLKYFSSHPSIAAARLDGLAPPIFLHFFAVL